MTTTPTLLDGLLDDDVPEELTARERADSLAATEIEAPLSAASADPGDGTVAPEINDDAVPAPPPQPEPAAREKLVIVEGQTFVVDAAIDNETIREHLVRQGFTNLVGAEIRTGTKSQNGQTLATVDFVKRAGTKG
jgi:hypothetical protein